MKKALIFLAGWLFVVGVGSLAEAMPLDFGIKTGMALSKVSFSGTIEGLGDVGDELNENIKIRSGWVGGVFATLHLSSSFSVQPEALYVQKGWVSEQKYQLFDVDANLIGVATMKDEYLASYCEIPLLGKWTAPAIGMVKSSLFAGPVMAFQLSHDGKMWIGGEEVTDVDLTGADELADKIKSADWGAVLGVEVAVGHILVDVRYDLGLMDILEGSGDVKTKSRSLIFMGGYRF